MRKHILRTLCIAFVLTLCLPMAACDFQFGGLVGELLANNAPGGGVVPDQWESDLVIEDILTGIEVDTEIAIESAWIDEVFTGDIAYPETETLPIGEPPETTSPAYPDNTTEVEPGPIPMPVLHFSFDECDAWIGEKQVQQFFTPGAQASWNGRDVISDYNVEYVRVWGWVAFQSEQIGKVGYSIDNGEPVYDDTFLLEAEQPILDAASGIGAGSVARISVMIPVRDLSGEHVIEIFAGDRDEFGYQSSIAYFVLEKAVDPNAPVFSFFPADMLSSMIGAPDLESVQLGGTGEYISITTGNIGDPWYLLPDIFGKGYVANYVTIKYRTSSETTSSNLYVGSGPGPRGESDELVFELINDGKWHLAVLDLSTVSEVQDGSVNYLRWDMFRGGQHNQIDLAYIAAFTSEQAALDYDASIADRYPD